MRRVVVTGMGVIAPCGNTTGEFWGNIKNGVSGIGPITKIDASDQKVSLAAEVRNFEPDKYMDRKDQKRMDLFCQYAVAAAKEAVESSGLSNEYMKGNFRVGAYIGSGIGGLQTLEDQITRLASKGPSRVAPLFIPMTIVNMASGLVALKYGFTGVSSSAVTACASSNNSIGDAFRSIKHGYMDVMLAGGTEAALSRIGLAGFANLTALSESKDPARASIPFDKERNGFVLGEGAGILVLEELEHARERGAVIYAEIAGYGSTSDAYHMTAPIPDGSSSYMAIKLALDEAGVKPEELGYINAHGTSTQPNDSSETMAIKRALGEETARKVPVSSTKSMHGHLLGSAGAVEAIVCIQALRDGFIPPTIGLNVPDPECDLDYVPNTGRSAGIRSCISNSFGFGGHNAVICFKKWEGK